MYYIGHCTDPEAWSQNLVHVFKRGNSVRPVASFVTRQSAETWIRLQGVKSATRLKQKRYRPMLDPSTDEWYVYDTVEGAAYGHRMFGRWVVHYRKREAAQTVADALNNPQKEDPMNPEDTYIGRKVTFQIFRRSTGTGFEPTGWQSRYLPLNETGAKIALSEYLRPPGGDQHSEYLRPPGGDQHGAYLVQHAKGSWTFTVEPPEPAPPTIKVI